MGIIVDVCFYLVCIDGMNYVNVLLSFNLIFEFGYQQLLCIGVGKQVVWVNLNDMKVSFDFVVQNVMVFELVFIGFVGNFWFKFY